MNRLAFYLRYALRSLRRDGTRSFLAGLSVTFGILSLISMQLLANALLRGEMFDQRVQYGGDAQIYPPDFAQSFTSNDLEQIEAWRQEGLISDYTLLSNGSVTFLTTATSGRVTFLANALGISPATYPLVGELVLREPSATAADVLKSPADVLITRDIAEKRGLRIGDSILLSGENMPLRLTVAGIIKATPTQQGDSVFYSLETARLIENREDIINTIAINWGTAPNAEQTIIDSPYRVFVAATRNEVVSSSSGTALFDLMLKGSGVLGLLVGGISVSNTLQVILTRRKLEIAMLKTLGYSRFDLIMMISLETGIIGLVGGIVGALVGAQIAGKLLDVLGAAGSLMLDWQPDPVIVIGGIMIGVLTAVVFGMQAILVTSATRPVQLLRDLPLEISRHTQLVRGALYLLMLVSFGVVVGVVLGSPLEGILYVLVGSIGIVVLRVIFWIVLWLALKFPVPPFPMLRLARASLRQRKMQLSLAAIALFAGSFSVTFAALAIYNAQSKVVEMRSSDEGYNLMVYTISEEVNDAVNHMILQGAQDTYVTEQVRGTLSGASIIIEGRSADDLNKDMQYHGEWDDAENIALLPDYESANYTVGNTLILNVNGQEKTATLVGFYTIDWNRIAPQPAPLIVPRQFMQDFGIVKTRVFGQFPVTSLNDVTTSLGQTLPEMLVFSRADINDAMVATYQSLFTFAASVAGLAFAAGAVLIANAAGLTIIERYREIGVFKAVGFTSGHVLRALLSEYGFLGGVAGIFGILGAIAAITLINVTQPGTELVIEPTILTVMLLLSVSVAVFSAGIVAWQPTRVRPIEVLRYE